MNPINVSIVRQGQVYRGPQPYTPAQWAYLKQIGIRTVCKWNYDDEGSDQGAIDTGMTVIKVPMPPRDVWQAVGRPDLTDVLRGAALLAESSLYPIFEHCTYGHDRTGIVTGVWRVEYCNWPHEQAFQEMMEYGFHPELLNLMWTWEQFKESREVK